MSSWREKISRFMVGRYGIDDLGKVTLYASLILLVLSIFLPWRILYILAVLMLIFCYVRMLSKNISKRYAENQKYTEFRYKIICKFANQKQDMKTRKTHHIYRCPTCSQKLRIPKGKGKIEIRCPKCNTQFVKKS